MLLTIDIGNTNITIGIFKYEAGRPVKSPAHLWRLATDKMQTADEYGTKILDLFHYALIETDHIKGVAVASVVPELNTVFDEAARKYFHTEAFFVTHKTPADLKIIYDNPAEVGADRIADSVAAFRLFGGPVVVIDFGTATTFDCVTIKGEYLGGAIAPGPGISAESLARRTSKLPRVNIIKPETAIGTSTVTSIQSGLYFGYVGLIKEILKRITSEMGNKPRLVATGGLAHLITPEIREVKAVIPELTLEGIRMIWEEYHK